MMRVLWLALVATLFIAGLSPGANAQGGRPQGGQAGSFKPWSIFVRGGAVHQFETDADQGGDFNVERSCSSTGSYKFS